ncbi:MAG: radical SAM protein [Thermodesulfobacteriota bacterium]|nr:radical SAM protein [Thermodesulfobacteriota bacterium]
MFFKPVYIKTFEKGLLKEKALQAREMLKNCTLCPRKCGVDRISGEPGICRTGKNAIVCSFNPHFGEELPLVGKNGSGTIFFSFCNMLCNFCQNYEISHQGEGQKTSHDQLAAMMLALQQQGCHNINFVTPSHVVPQILSALERAVPLGLKLPIVYNTGAYDSVETLKLLDGVVDIYMPDFKFIDVEVARLAGVPEDYPETAEKAIIEMHRQVGDLVVDSSGIAQHGLLLRHLVLPGDLAGTGKIMKFLAEEVSCRTYVNIMSQYRPCGTAYKIKPLSRQITIKEYKEAFRISEEQGITRFDKR